MLRAHVHMRPTNEQFRLAARHVRPILGLDGLVLLLRAHQLLGEEAREALERARVRQRFEAADRGLKR